MKVNWKSFSASKGYKSLKAAVIYDIKQKCTMRSNAEYWLFFHRVISKAIHHAHIKNVTPESILDVWEENRGYWYLNYYSEIVRTRLDTAPNLSKPNYYRNSKLQKSNKKPERWSHTRKDRVKRLGY